MAVQAGNFPQRPSAIAQTLSLSYRTVLPLCLFLAGCSSVPIAVCPAIVPYTAEQQTQAADELETLPPDAMTRRFMTDYGVLRAKLRSCQ